MLSSINVQDILNLIGGELKDASEPTKRFRDFISLEKWDIEQYKEWLEECTKAGKGAQDPVHRAFQDLIVTLGKKIGFEIEYGRYTGKPGEIGYDGIWKRGGEEKILLEIKSTTWPISSISQLGDYIEKVSKEESNEKIYGLYVIGQGDLQPLIEQISGSKYKDRMRVIKYDDLIELTKLKEELEPTIGGQEAITKTQNILLPIESINVGNILGIILDIAATKSEASKEKVEGEGEITEEKETKKELPWTKEELFEYLNEATGYQRLLLASLAQSDEEYIPKKTVVYWMNKIAKERPDEGIEKEVSGVQIAGARAGLKMRRSPPRREATKENIIWNEWDDKIGDYVYWLESRYKNIIVEWVKKERLWIKGNP